MGMIVNLTEAGEGFGGKAAHLAALLDGGFDVVERRVRGDGETGRGYPNSSRARRDAIYEKLPAWRCYRCSVPSPSETASSLVRREDAAQLARERIADEVRAQAVQCTRANLPAGASAWLIGSLAWGGFGDRSDVDVVVRGLDRNQATTLELALSRATAREVDLLRYEDLPASFRERVLREGTATT